MVSAVVVGLALRAGEGPVRAVETPALRGAPEPFVVAANVGPADEKAHPKARSEVRIGSFERPEEVPGYKIFDEVEDERYGARGAWLLVGVHSQNQEEYVLITRDLKARYAHLDAVSIEFIDLSRTLRYSGGALIFNTAAGADYIGYFHSPPNNEGYYVKAAD